MSFSEYLNTVSPTIEFEDSTEFIATSYILGITHPTGYPLYNILGKIFSNLPFKNPNLDPGRDVHSIAFRYNMFNCFLGSLGLVLIFYLVFHSAIEIMQNFVEKDPVFARVAIGIAAFAGTFATMFSRTYWRQTTFAEVYLLHIVLLLFQVFLLFRWRLTVINGKEDRFILYLFSFLYGLSFGNHMTMVTFMPAHLLFIFITSPELLLSPASLLRCAFFYFMGLSIYIYLPLRSAMGAEFSWFPIDSWDKFSWVVFAKSYGATNLAAKLKGLTIFKFFGPKINHFFLKMAFREISFPFILVGLAGIIYSLLRLPIKSLYLLALFFPNLFYFMLYQYHADFLLPQFVLWGIFCGFGFLLIVDLMRVISPDWAFLPLLVILVFLFSFEGIMKKTMIDNIPTAKGGLYNQAKATILKNIPDAAPFFSHAQKIRQQINRNQNYSAYQYAVNTLNHIGKNGVAIFSQDAMAPLMYWQYVERKRPDITLVHEFLYPFRKFGLNEVPPPHPHFQAKMKMIEEEYIKPFFDFRPCYFVAGDPGRKQTFNYLFNYFKKDYDFFPRGFLFRLVRKDRVYTLMENEKKEKVKKLKNPFIASNYEVVNPEPENKQDIRWGNLFTQIGYNINKREFMPGDTLELVLFFKTTLPIKTNYKMFIYLTEKKGNYEYPFYTKFRAPTEGLWPTTRWKWKHIVRDEFHLVILNPPFKKTKTYNLKMGFFHPGLPDDFRINRLKMMPKGFKPLQEKKGKVKKKFEYHILNLGKIKVTWDKKNPGKYPVLKTFKY
ncbi:DUF2723 domain-containing protein [Candidatus Riflebacteria bacterium]